MMNVGLLEQDYTVLHVYIKKTVIFILYAVRTWNLVVKIRRVLQIPEYATARLTVSPL
jgi:hypothetical protein